MDLTLRDKMEINCINAQTTNACFGKKLNSPAFLVIIFATLLVFQTGCLTSKLGSTDLPVPPPVLDVSSLDNVRYQSPDGMAPSTGPRNRVRSLNDAILPTPKVESADPSALVADISIKGNRSVPSHQLMRNIRTRPGRYFDPDILQQDIDMLWRMPEISRVKSPLLEKTPKGVIITIEVQERNTISEVKFIGNRGIPDRVLLKELDLNDGDPLDVHQIRMGKQKIEDLYKEKGYPRTQVEILEGNEVGDANVAFLIHEDEKQRIWKVDFEGNEIASDARLRHFIKSKPGILKVFGGLVKRDEIEQDIVRLTSYYRSLGFFNARIGREVSESNDGRWLTISFIINEGPRYKVRNVAFIGNNAYSNEQLLGMLELVGSQSEGVAPEFNVAKMNQDVVSLRDLYGGQGFVFAKVDAEPRFLEEPGLLDIVYKIDEGKQYYVGDVNVHFQGDYGITKREVVLNRLSLRPGDLINVQKIRNSERRLGSAQIFADGRSAGGAPPKIVIRPPELKDLERYADESANGDNLYR